MRLILFYTKFEFEIGTQIFVTCLKRETKRCSVKFLAKIIQSSCKMAENISTKIQLEKKLAENEKNFANQSLKEQNQAKAKNEVKLFYRTRKI